ncbi:flagellin domain protein [Sulfuricurvum kujiense DSM 16994]|uniref:Flagellin n=1 Tax=Sulfuricurvum kujiense (strain ATCC BAA-921 / DSM 16994 / JCM 11577 / YK-1) TaxID=709032 RepID=E4TXD4_SULKY|nr:flagellin [Sulfuricurvum kujiense]ADR32831.1 flagellin domain protein [Sulfuricurvum kujiense DSM 16994]
MGFRINTNIAAMTAHTSGVMNNRNLDESLSKLSSGLRINKAADDASGMVIANALRNQANSLGQAISNGNDAIGLIQTADGALNEYSKILDTIKTKAVQASSDGQNTSSRLAIQKDISRLMEELNTIAKTTSFNGQKLLSGSFTNKTIQMGASSNEGVNFSVASTEPNKIGHTSRAQLNLASEVGSVQLTMKSALTGENITMKAIDIQYNNTPENGMGALADEINSHSGITGIRAKAVVEVTSGSAIAAGTTGSGFAINGINIGAINVKANDGDGALMAAINGKTTQTGVAATITDDGKITLKATDGRAIKVEGNVSDVFGGTANQLSTVGYIELVQKGAAEFQVSGIGAGAVGGTINLSGATSMVKDSILAAGSSIAVGSTLKVGTTIGGDVNLTAATTLVLDGTLKAGTTAAAGTTFAKGTTMGAAVNLTAAVALSADMYITAGSTLVSGTIFDAGTLVQQDFTVNGVTYHKGDVLSSDVTLTASLTLTSDMTINVDLSGTANSSIATASTINVGSVLGGNIVSSSTATVSEDMTLKSGSILAAASKLKAGSVLGADTVNSSAVTTYTTTDLKAGSSLAAASTLKEGSTIGGTVINSSAITLNADMTIKAGSTLATGTVIKAGTVLMQDLTAAQTGASAMSAGDKVTVDITTGAAITLSADLTLLRGTGTAPTIAAGSTLMPNTENSGRVGIDAGEVTNLSSISVLNLTDAMKAIDTLDAAIGDLDTIRADLGSVQNQLTATINNISVTQVNVKAAESQLRDVDFAAESANFSKFNILAQSGSYAMSQANAVQQNVLKLLQ